MIKIRKGWNRNPIELVKYWLRNNYFPQRAYNVSNKLKSKYQNGLEEFPIMEINIETINRCNNNCSFCASSTINEKRPKLEMTDETFNRVVEQIKTLDFIEKIFVRPNINNEILLDKKIVERVKILSAIPNVYLTCESNGKLFSEEKLYALFSAGMKHILIDDYADNLFEYFFNTKHIRKLLQQIDIYRINDDVELVIQHRLKKQKLTDRSGKVKGQKNKLDANKLFCDYPFTQVNINPEGNLIICCRDVYYDCVLGNIWEDELLNLWNSNFYKEVRKSLLGGVKTVELCKKCKSIGRMTI